MEKRSLKNSARPHQCLALSVMRSWRVVVIVVLAAVSIYLDARAIGHAGLPFSPYTVLLSAVVGLVLSGNGQPALELTALGSVPSTDEQDYPDRLVVLKAPDSPVAESYRVLHQYIQPDAANYPLHRLVVTSSFPLDGKSAIAANLAALIAQAGKRVVLVDADLQHPTQHCIFELDNQAGLTDALQAGVVNDQSLNNLPVQNLSILPSGPLIDSVSEMLDSGRMKGLLDALQQRVDVVIIDSSPIAALADAKMMAARLGATLLVIESTSAPRTFVERSKNALDRLGAHLSGAPAERLPASSDDYYYYRYYSEHGYSQEPSITGLPMHPFDRLERTAQSKPGDSAGHQLQTPTLDTRQFDQPADLDLLRARVNMAVRRFRTRSALGVALLVVLALVILTIVFISSLSKQQTDRINREATRAAIMALTISVDTAKANQTATAVARDSTRRLTVSALTQTAAAEAAITAAAATQQAMFIAAQRTPTPTACDIDIEILQSPTLSLNATTAIVNVEMVWRVRNRATLDACKWGQAGQETRLLRAVEIGGELGIEALVQLKWIQADEYDLAIKVPLTAEEHNLVWKLIPPGARSPSGPDLIARVVITAPTFTPVPAVRPAPTDCPLEVYPCNCSEECGPRGCQKSCDSCTRPKCD